jgi:hypothetical protein
MTVGELIESLKTLPQDMEIMVINKHRHDPVDITLVSRGGWGVDPDDEYEERFIQDDENGDIAVLVTW